MAFTCSHNRADRPRGSSARRGGRAVGSCHLTRGYGDCAGKSAWKGGRTGKTAGQRTARLCALLRRAVCHQLAHTPYGPGWDARRGPQPIGNRQEG